MPPPSSAYSVENFEPSPDEELVCSVCRCVFNDPVECPCRHVFCRACISNWLERKPSCPVCRKRVVQYNLRPVVPVITNMIAKLRLNCPNMELGCADKISLEGYDSHLKVCQYELVECKYAKCKQSVIRAFIEAHEKKECKYRLVRCHRDCKLMVSCYKLRKHDCVTELKKLLQARKQENKALKKQNSELQDKCRSLESELRELKNARSSSDSLYNTDSSLNFSSSSSSVLLPFSDSWSLTSESTSTSSNSASFSIVFDNDEYYTNDEDQNSDTRHSDQSNRQSQSYENDSSANEYRDEANNDYQDEYEPMTDVVEFPKEATLVSERDDESKSREGPGTIVDKNQKPQEKHTGNETMAVDDANEPGPSGLHAMTGSTRKDASSREGTENAEGFSRESSSPNAHQKRKRATPVIFDSSNTEDDDVALKPSRKKSNKSISSESSSGPTQEDNSVENINLSPSTEISVILATQREISSSLSNTRSSKERQCRENQVLTASGSAGLAQKLFDSFRTGLQDSSHSTPNISPESPSPVHASPESPSLLSPTQSASCRGDGHIQSDNSITSARRTRRAALHNQRSTRARRPSERVQDSEEALPQTSALLTAHPTLPRTVKLLHRYAVESDPDWEPDFESSSSESERVGGSFPGSSSPRAVADDNTSEFSSPEHSINWDSESSYEVQVPERTWDLLVRYSEEPSDEDQDWEPPVM